MAVFWLQKCGQNVVNSMVILVILLVVIMGRAQTLGWPAAIHPSSPLPVRGQLKFTAECKDCSEGRRLRIGEVLFSHLLNKPAFL
jgi:hypothetical protein